MKISTFLKKLFIRNYKRYSVSQQVEDELIIEWKKIDELLRVGGPSQLKQALIFADKSLDGVLRSISSGETLGERLKNSRNRFELAVYNKIWEAHKVRNALVHESGYDPQYYIVVEAIEKLRTGMKSLGLRI